MLGIKASLKKKLGWLGSPKIIPYTSYGDDEKIMITGAVVEDKGIQAPEPEHGIWKNILNMIKRYTGDELPGVRVKIEYGNNEEVVRTNESGLFHTVLPNKLPRSGKKRWQTVKLTLLDQVTEKQDIITAKSEVHIHNKYSDFIVVSDLDDTVMISHSTRTFRKVRLMLSKNALTRSPFEGVSEFYRALNESADGKERSIFYVSGSEWNLYDLLTDFLNAQEIPRGPLLLSDAKLKLFSMLQSGKKYKGKINRIKELFELYYHQDFILIGDSGQKDPEIYLKIAEMYPSRVKAIYIRYIGKRKHNKRLNRLIKLCTELGTEMVIVNSTTEAARHAQAKGYIIPEHIEKIRRQKQKEARLEQKAPLIDSHARLK